MVLMDTVRLLVRAISAQISSDFWTMVCVFSDFVMLLASALADAAAYCPQGPKESGFWLCDTMLSCGLTNSVS